MASVAQPQFTAEPGTPTTTKTAMVVGALVAATIFVIFVVSAVWPSKSGFHGGCPGCGGRPPCAGCGGRPSCAVCGAWNPAASAEYAAISVAQGGQSGCGCPRRAVCGSKWNPAASAEYDAIATAQGA